MSLPTNLTNFSTYTAETSTPGHDHDVEVSMLLELYTKSRKATGCTKLKTFSGAGQGKINPIANLKKAIDPRTAG
jgi:hypothetical protein